MSLLVVLSRLCLAAIFVVSAIAKLRDRPGSRRAITDFGIPTPLVGVVVSLLPLAELTSAVLLLLADPAAAVGAMTSVTLLVLFTTLIVINLLRGNRVDCHCFGQVGSSAIGWPTVGRNAVLLTLAALSLIGVGQRDSVPGELADYSVGQLAAGVGVLLIVGALVTLGLTVRALLVRYGGVLLRLEALELATGTAEPASAPSFVLPALEGPSVILRDVLAEQRPVLLVFVSPTCTLCADLLPELAHWQATAGFPLRVLVTSDGTAEANREKTAQRAPSLHMLLTAGTEVSSAYGVQGTPAAVLIGVDGRLASPMTYAVPEIRALVARTVHAMAGAQPRPAQPSHPQARPGGTLPQAGPRPVSPGDRLPEIEVETENGDLVALRDQLPDQAVLLFWRSSCGYCARILDDVRALESSLSLVLVTISSTEEIRGSGLRSPLVRDPSRTLNSALQVPGTPAAAAVRRHVLSSDIAVGGPGVLDLLRAESHSASLTG